MELLVGLLVEFVVSLAWPVIAIFFDLIATFLALIAHVIFGLPGRRRQRSRQRRGGPETPSQDATGPAKSSGATGLGSKLTLAAAGVFGAIFMAGVAAVLVANYWFFTPTVTWLAGKITARSGIEISFSDAKGDFVAGNVAFTDLVIRRRNTQKTEYAFSVRSAGLNVSLLSLVFGDAELSNVTVAGVTGDIWTKVDDTAAAGDKAAGARGEARPRRHFAIDTMQLSDVNIALHRGDTPPLSLTIDRLRTEQLRSRYVVYDVFFRSDVTGRINGNEIYIASARKVGGRSTRWRLSDFPAELVRHYVDKAPFKWFEEGVVDVVVEDHWTSADHAEIDTSWNIVLKGVKVVEPKNSRLVDRVLGTPIARYINARDKDINFSLRFVMDQEQFRLKPSLDAAGVWDAVLSGTARHFAETSKQTADEIKQNLKQSLGKFKDFLNDWRKK